MQISTKEFQEFRDFLQTVAGIDLAENKQYLVTTRVRRILLDNKMETLGELTKSIKMAVNRPLCQKVIDAMTTNETFWFRDTYPFDYLRDTILPQCVEKSRSEKVRIWSAACSSGQEPYSISMVVEEFLSKTFGVTHLPLEIVGTDLSNSVLEKARNGSYDQLLIGRGLSQQRLAAFFDQVSPGVWQIKAPLKKRVSFKALNLLDQYTLLGRFDIVFCRNVLIYFSSQLKQDILRRIHATMKPGGWLFLGSSESLAGVSGLFEVVHCSQGVVYIAIK